MSGDVNFIAVGDVAPDRKAPGTIFNHVRERIRKADLGFCQLEVNLTERGQRVPQARHTMRGDPGIADALVDAGLEVVSFAGNHAMDWGPEGLLDTIANLNRAGASQVGTGPDITAARKPVIVTRNGLKVGFVAVNSILPMNYWADENKPGCAPVRGFTVYEQIEHDQPGTPARIHTYPHHGDLETTLDAIRWTKQRADVVVFSHHAGIHFVQAVIPDYQRDVAYAAIDAGADLVLGHHAHILKGAEVYKGVPILYSLANFAIELTMTKEHAESKGFREIQKLNPDWVPDLESRYNFPPDSAMSIAVEARLTSNGVADLRLVPVFIDRTADPQFVPPEDARFGRILNYLQKISDEAGLATEFSADGDVIRLKART